MKRILVGFDGTEPARRALERAAALAQAVGASLVVASAEPSRQARAPVESVQPPLSLPGPLHGPTAIHPAGEPPDEWVDHLVEARSLLEARGIEAELVAEVGDPADTLVALAEQRDVDLIVVGTRDPGVLQRLLGQSVSESVVRHAERDVLVVR